MTDAAASLPVTLTTAGLLGLILVVLSVRVTTMRVSTRVMLGDGMTTPGEARALPTRSRAHANFAEYVPLALLLLAAVELIRGPGPTAVTLAGLLVLARIMHPIGMALRPPNLFRAGGFFLTLLMIVAASTLVLAAALP